MTKPFDFGAVKLHAGGTGPGVPNPEIPFRLLVLGDFSGRADHGVCETGANLARRHVIELDRDNFDTVLRSLRPEIVLRMGGEPGMRLHFTELDDFHPDHLFQQAEIFRRLRVVRARLSDPATFLAAAEELGISCDAPPATKKNEAARNAAEPSVERIISGSLLDEMIEQTEARTSAARPSHAPDELQQFVRRITEPHLVAAANPRQVEAVAMIDRALGAQMRALLHVPQLQSLEAAWRALFLLVRRVDTDSQLKICLLDVSKAELAVDLAASEDLAASGMFRLLVEKTVGTPGAEPWALLAGNYTFGPEQADVQLLARLAKIACASGAPFLAAASLGVLGCQSLADLVDPRAWRLKADVAAGWASLRGLPESASVGLALPRFLLRLPYGTETDPIESFAFEEMPNGPDHENYLWGNPAIACALLLAQSFHDEQWDMRAGARSEIERLPLHVYQQGGASELTPCAETLLPVIVAERMLESGVMPLASLKGQDSVRLVRFQSIAEPLRPLAGRWQRRV